MNTSTDTSGQLTAKWSNMAVINFAAPPELLTPFLPNGLRLAPYEQTQLLSLVGFQFADTRIGAFPVPFYGRFTEVYLGFFASRTVDSAQRRGWVFVRKIVPSRAVATIGKLLYNEDYIRRPMREDVTSCRTASGHACSVSYQWLNSGRWNGMTVRAEPGQGNRPEPGSIEDFFCHNYGGFAEKRGGGSIEFPVTHPEWLVWTGTSATLDCDVGEIYGTKFESVLGSPPHSSFIVSGSAVGLGKAEPF